MKGKNIKRAAAALTVACMAAGTFAGCGTEKTGEAKPLVWYVPMSVKGDHYDAVMKQVNEKLAAYDLQLDVIGIEGGTFDQKMQVLNAGREEYDLAFTSGWRNDYYKNVSSGAFEDITEVLPVHAPKLYESMQESIWDAIRVDGKLYAVPNWQMMVKSVGVLMPKEKVDAAGVDYTKIATLEDVEDYLTKLKAVDPECNKVGTFWNMIAPYYGYTDLLAETLPGAIKYAADGKPVVVNQYESEEFESYIKLRRSWVEKGLTPDVYLPGNNYSDKAVKQVPFTVHSHSPVAAADYSKANEYEWVSVQIAPALLSSNSVNSALTGVSTTTSSVENSVKLLEVVNNDTDIYNLLVWGIEGADYEKDADGRIAPYSGKNYALEHWIVGSVKNSLVLNTKPADVWKQVDEFNNSAIASPVVGFTPDVDNLGTELANCKTVLNEQLELLELGLTEPDEGIAKLRDALKTAGADTIIAELQAQIDEWWAATK